MEAAKLSGVDVVTTTIKAYLVSATCACVVGLILCAQAGMGNMEAGNMYEMYGVAAGVIGGISPLGGTGERPQHDRRPGWHPAPCDRHHRGICGIAGRSGPLRKPRKEKQAVKRPNKKNDIQPPQFRGVQYKKRRRIGLMK